MKKRNPLTRLLDHRWGAGRINPRRLGALLHWRPARRTQEGGIFRALTTFLLALCFVAVVTNQSPVAVFQDGLEHARAAGLFLLHLFNA